MDLQKKDIVVRDEHQARGQSRKIKLSSFFQNIEGDGNRIIAVYLGYSWRG